MIDCASSTVESDDKRDDEEADSHDTKRLAPCEADGNDGARKLQSDLLART